MIVNIHESSKIKVVNNRSCSSLTILHNHYLLYSKNISTDDYFVLIDLLINSILPPGITDYKMARQEILKSAKSL